MSDVAAHHPVVRGDIEIVSKVCAVRDGPVAVILVGVLAQRERASAEVRHDETFFERRRENGSVKAAPYSDTHLSKLILALSSLVASCMSVLPPGLEYGG